MDQGSDQGIASAMPTVALSIAPSGLRSVAPEEPALCLLQTSEA